MNPDISATEIKSNFDEYTDVAMSKPVFFQRPNGDGLVMLSFTEYQHLKGHDRQVILTKDLNDEFIALLTASEASEESKSLDYLMEDDMAPPKKT